MARASNNADSYIDKLNTFTQQDTSSTLAQSLQRIRQLSNSVYVGVYYRISKDTKPICHSYSNEDSVSLDLLVTGLSSLLHGCEWAQNRIITQPSKDPYTSTEHPTAIFSSDPILLPIEYHNNIDLCVLAIGPNEQWLGEIGSLYRGYFSRRLEHIPSWPVNALDLLYQIIDSKILYTGEILTIPFSSLLDVQKQVCRNLTTANLEFGKILISVYGYCSYPYREVTVAKDTGGIRPSYCYKHGFIVITLPDNTLGLLISNPLFEDQISHVCRILTISKTNVFVTTPVEFIKSRGKHEFSSLDLSTFNSTQTNRQITAQDSVIELDEKAIDDQTLTVTRLVDRILARAVSTRASDIHITMLTDKTAQVRLRIDGACQQITTLPIDGVLGVVARVKVIAGLDIAEKRFPQDGKFKRSINQQDVNFRVVTVPTIHGEGVVIRILRSQDVLTLATLDVNCKIDARLRELVKLKHGLILVTGPTGSGKTTTLHALLHEINSEPTTIWTAEDPVEITQPGINQLHIKKQSEFGFADAIRTFLRADPDVILIGEMRDHETAKAATQAAMTGHLVLSTLHTNSAIAAIRRLLNLGIEAFNIADACVAVVAQRLLRTLCDQCKQSTEISELQTDIVIAHQQRLGLPLPLALSEHHKVFSANRCEHCENTGYSGRLGIYELMVITPEIHNAIVTNLSSAKIYTLAREKGYIPLSAVALDKWLEGKVTFEDIKTLL